MKAEIATKKVVYELPGMHDVTVRRVEYSPGLTMDLYMPHEAQAQTTPAVVVALGYPDAGVPLIFGCQFREMDMYICWGQLFAASGMVGVLYETGNPATDVHAVLAYLRNNAAELQIDESRIGVWAASGNVPVALSVLMDDKVQCGMLCYGFTLDLDGSTNVAQASKQFYFANPCAGRSVDDLPKETPLFIARAGQDQFAGLNESMDAFLAAAVRRNLPITFVNHPTGAHGFDIADDSETSKQIVRAILAFLGANLNLKPA